MSGSVVRMYYPMYFTIIDGKFEVLFSSEPELKREKVKVDDIFRLFN